MKKSIQIQPLTQANFAAFGDVIEKENHDFFPINQGLTERYHALSIAQVSGDNVAVGIGVVQVDDAAESEGRAARLDHAAQFFQQAGR